MDSHKHIDSQQSGQKDCLACRIVGAGTFAAVGSYALWQSRTTAPGTVIQKRFLAVFGAAFLVGGAVRWTR